MADHMDETGTATEVADPDCLQCGEKRSRARSESLFCCTVSVGEQTEVDQEWEHHRWADWTDRELDRVGIKAAAYDKHRRTAATLLSWVDCDDTKIGHSPADEDAVGAMWVDRIGQCLRCGQMSDARPGKPSGGESRV